MRGVELRRLMEERGQKSRYVAERAGYGESHLSKIFKKEDISTDEFVRIATAIGVKPGDLIENSVGDLGPLLPIIDDLRQIEPSAIPKLRSLLSVAKELMGVGSSLPVPITTQSVERKLETAQRLMANGNVVRMPNRTIPRWTPEFPIQPHEFNDNGETDFPLELHGWEVEDFEAAAGAAGIENHGTGDMTTLLNAKEVRDGSIRTVRVRGDSMSPVYQHGWKLAIDVTQKTPTNRDPVVVYRKDEGTIIGYFERTTRGARLLKANRAHEPVELNEGDMIVGTVAYIAWQPAQKMPIDSADDSTARARPAKKK